MLLHAFGARADAGAVLAAAAGDGPPGGRRFADVALLSAASICFAPPGEAWPAAARAVARQLGVPILTHIIDEAEWPRLYGVSPTGAVLVRPDGHIAWRHRTAPGPGVHNAKTQLAAAMTSASCVHATSPRATAT